MVTPSDFPRRNNPPYFLTPTIKTPPSTTTDPYFFPSPLSSHHPSFSLSLSLSLSSPPTIQQYPQPRLCRAATNWYGNDSVVAFCSYAVPEDSDDNKQFHGYSGVFISSCGEIDLQTRHPTHNLIFCLHLQSKCSWHRCLCRHYHCRVMRLTLFHPPTPQKSSL